jgi:hypothetical protein
MTRKTKAPTRQIIQTFEGQTEHDGGLGAWSSDEACLRWAEDLNASAVAAWWFWKQAHADKEQCLGCDAHPLLTVSIVAEGLDAYPHVKFYSPMVDAALRYQRIPEPPTEVKVWRYDTAAGRMLRSKSQPYAKARANGVSLSPRAPRIREVGRETEPTALQAALESIETTIHHVHSHHADGTHCPSCPAPHRQHPDASLTQGATGTGQGASSNGQGAGSQLHRVKLWTPTPSSTEHLAPST